MRDSMSLHGPRRPPASSSKKFVTRNVAAVYDTELSKTGIPPLLKGINILEASSGPGGIENWTNPAFQNRNPKFQNVRVQFAISAFGFEMQDSSNFRFPFNRWCDASTILMPF
jgi:hypothetical protein